MDTSPPYHLGGLCIIAWLHLGVSISNVDAIANHVAELFPAVYSADLFDLVRQVFNDNAVIFLYIFEQPLDLRCLNHMVINEYNALLYRSEIGNGMYRHLYRPTLYTIIVEEGYDLRKVKLWIYII